MSTYDEVVAALARPSTYPHSVPNVRHLHTHISDVFLAGSYAYKLKKPVNLGFLDFGTLERRRRACEEELHLNRRLAPEIYLDVVPIVRDPDAYRVGAPGDTEAVEYAVRMRRLPQRGLLDALADRGRLTAVVLRAAAAQIATFHAHAARGIDIDAYGTVANITARIDQNFIQTRSHVGTLFDAATYSELAVRFARFLEEHGQLFEQRIAEGRIVDGHGDLHLRNMCLYRGRLVIFDCIEFSLAYRAGDVINDAAFLAMDLRARNLAPLAAVFVNEYLERTQDYGALALLDFYQAYRAHVRAKVAALTFSGERERHAAATARDAARNYLDLALRCFLPQNGGVVIMSGVSGSGKSTVAGRLAQSLGGIVVRSDAVRKHLAGIGRGRTSSAYGEGIYSQEMSDRTYSGMLERARVIIASGRWAILDATHPTRMRRDSAARFARELGIPFAILHCRAPREELEQRLQRRALTNELSDAGIEVLRQQLRAFEAPSPDEGPILEIEGAADVNEAVRRLRQRVPRARGTAALFARSD